MKIKGLIETDLINYKYPCMTIEMPYCSFKCDKECGERVCQNSALAAAADIEISVSNLIERYIKNPVTTSIVFQSLKDRFFGAPPLFERKRLQKYCFFWTTKIFLHKNYTRARNLLIIISKIFRATRCFLAFSSESGCKSSAIF